MYGLMPFNRRNRGRRGLQNMIDDFFNDWPMDREFMTGTFKLDVKEEKDKYVVEAEVPGAEKDDIEVRYDDGQLKISIERDESIDEEKDNYIHKERRVSSMERSVYLVDTKSEGIEASLDNGLLTIEVPKDKESKGGRSIEIK